MTSNEKISLAIKKCWERPEYRAAHMGLPNPFKGKQHTAEAKAKIGLASKKRCQNSEYRARMKCNTKTQFQNPNQRAMASSSAKKRWQNPEYMEHMKAIHTGRHPSEKTLAKMQTATRLLTQNPQWRANISAGHKRTWQDPEYRAFMSAMHKKCWQDPDFAKRVLRRRRKKPNKGELRLQDILDKHFPNQWKFVGDGQLIIGNRCPDFVNVDGKKQLIELFGTYWHPIFDVAQRKEHYRQYGFRVAIIWEDELEDEERLVKTLKRKLR